MKLNFIMAFSDLREAKGMDIKMKEIIKQPENRERIADSRKHSGHLRSKAVCFGIVCVLAGTLLTGCGSAAEGNYTREELNNFARLELYDAESGTLLKTVEDEETLYQFCKVGTAGLASEDAYMPEEGENLRETAEAAGASCYLEVYQYPAAKFGDKTPQKIYTFTLYQNTNIARVAVEDAAVKNIKLPEELLTFYYEMSEEESAFYESLLEEE